MEINKLVSDYKQTAANIINHIVADIEKIKGYCIENEEAFTPENNALNNAVDIVEFLRNDISPEVKESYINYFKGNNKALKTLSAAFNKHGIMSDISKYIIDTDSQYNDYIEAAKNLVFDDTSIVMPLLSLYHGVIKTAEDLGVHFTDEQKQSKIEFNINDLQNDIAKKAMGLA